MLVYFLLFSPFFFASVAEQAVPSVQIKNSQTYWKVDGSLSWSTWRSMFQQLGIAARNSRIGRVILPFLAGVDSTGECNTFIKYIRGGTKAARFSWTRFELLGNTIEVELRQA